MSSAEQLAFNASPLPADFVDEWRRLEAAAGVKPATLEAVSVCTVLARLWVTVAINGREWAVVSQFGACAAAKTVWAARETFNAERARRFA